MGRKKWVRGFLYCLYIAIGLAIEILSFTCFGEERESVGAQDKHWDVHACEYSPVSGMGRNGTGWCHLLSLN